MTLPSASCFVLDEDRGDVCRARNEDVEKPDGAQCWRQGSKLTFEWFAADVVPLEQRELLGVGDERGHGALADVESVDPGRLHTVCEHIFRTDGGGVSHGRLLYVCASCTHATLAPMRAEVTYYSPGDRRFTRGPGCRPAGPTVAP